MKRSKKHGNLLIQLSIAMIVMGFLMKFTLPNLEAFTGRASETEILSEFKELQTATVVVNLETSLTKISDIHGFVKRLNTVLNKERLFTVAADNKSAYSTLTDPFGYKYQLLLEKDITGNAVNIVYTATGGIKQGKSISLLSFKDKALASKGEVAYSLSAKLFGMGEIGELSSDDEKVMINGAPPSNPDGGNKPTPPTEPPTPPIDVQDDINSIYEYRLGQQLYMDSSGISSWTAIGGTDADVNGYGVALKPEYRPENDPSGAKLQAILKTYGGAIPQPAVKGNNPSKSWITSLANLFYGVDFGDMIVSISHWEDNNVKSIRNMFEYAQGIQSLKLDAINLPEIVAVQDAFRCVWADRIELGNNFGPKVKYDASIFSYSDINNLIIGDNLFSGCTTNSSYGYFQYANINNLKIGNNAVSSRPTADGMFDCANIGTLEIGKSFASNAVTSGSFFGATSSGWMKHPQARIGTVVFEEGTFLLKSAQYAEVVNQLKTIQGTYLGDWDISPASSTYVCGHIYDSPSTDSNHSCRITFNANTKKVTLKHNPDSGYPYTTHDGYYPTSIDGYEVIIPTQGKISNYPVHIVKTHVIEFNAFTGSTISKMYVGYEVNLGKDAPWGASGNTEIKRVHLLPQYYIRPYNR